MDLASAIGPFRVASGSFVWTLTLRQTRGSSYFFFSRFGDLVLVEDTQLRAEVLRKQNDFGYLEQDIRTQHIEKLICDENALKVYGSLFVLYRFLSRRITSDMSLDIDTIRFWLVVNNDQQDNAMALNEITWLLRQNLRAELGKTIVGDVEVMAREFLLKNMKARLCKSRHIYI